MTLRPIPVFISAFSIAFLITEIVLRFRAWQRPDLWRHELLRLRRKMETARTFSDRMACSRHRLEHRRLSGERRTGLRAAPRALIPTTLLAAFLPILVTSPFFPWDDSALHTATLNTLKALGHNSPIHGVLNLLGYAGACSALGLAMRRYLVLPSQRIAEARHNGNVPTLRRLAVLALTSLGASTLLALALYTSLRAGVFSDLWSTSRARVIVVGLLTGVICNAQLLLYFFRILISQVWRHVPRWFFQFARSSTDRLLASTVPIPQQIAHAMAAVVALVAAVLANFADH